jgi:hypothetical protein
MTQPSAIAEFANGNPDLLAAVRAGYTGLAFDQAGNPLVRRGTVNDRIVTDAELAAITDLLRPVILSQPISVSGSVGSSLSLSCLGGTLPNTHLDLAYQWEISTDDGETFGAVDGAIEPTLAFVSAQESDSGIYRCRVSNQLGATYTDAVQLDVFANWITLANEQTPKLALWSQRVSDVSYRFLVPYSGTHAYFYTFSNPSDDCMIWFQGFRRQYSVSGNTVNQGTIESQVKNGSNFEVAIRCRKNGTSDPYQFFPGHSSISTAFLKGSRLATRDSVVVSANDSAYVQCDEFVLDNTYEVIHPDEPNPLAEFRIVHSITPDRIRADVYLEWLQDVQITSGYSVMNNIFLSAPRQALGKVGSENVPVTLLSGNTFPSRQSEWTACLMRQQADTSVIVADWSNNRDAVLANQEFSNISQIQWFASTSDKFYNQPFFNCVVPQGRTFQWHGEWTMAQWGSAFP